MTDAENPDTLVAKYQYDGQHRRIAKLLPNGENWKRTDYYYNTSPGRHSLGVGGWQLI